MFPFWIDFSDLWQFSPLFVATASWMLFMATGGRLAG
jgi:hypothetical protein